MSLRSGYSLELAQADAADIDAGLAALQADAATKRDAGRLLRVLQDVASRGRGAERDNVHMSSTKPALHSVKVGRCAAFYAYGQANEATAIFLLGFYRSSDSLLRVGDAAARLANVR